MTSFEPPNWKLRVLSEDDSISDVIGDVWRAQLRRNNASPSKATRCMIGFPGSRIDGVRDADLWTRQALAPGEELTIEVGECADPMYAELSAGHARVTAVVVEAYPKR